MLNAFFIQGNKRSGSSHLVRLLNMHRQVFISHESDVIWILYQLHTHNNMHFSKYPFDGPVGMESTLRESYHILNENNSLTEKFFAIQKLLMEKGILGLPPMTKTDVVWVGDKKPYQYADPKLVEFILDIFPEAHFIHLIRHPFAVAKSGKSFRGGG